MLENLYYRFVGSVIGPIAALTAIAIVLIMLFY